jgi:hypothetical protein
MPPRTTKFDPLSQGAARRQDFFFGYASGGILITFNVSASQVGPICRRELLTFSLTASTGATNFARLMIDKQLMSKSIESPQKDIKAYRLTRTLARCFSMTAHCSRYPWRLPSLPW